MTLARKIEERLLEIPRFLPVFFILLILFYTFSSSAKYTIDSLLHPVTEPEYPAFLEGNDIIVRNTVFHDAEGDVEGAVIEIRKPVVLAKTGTDSMKPMFGEGNILVQEKLNEDTRINLGDIVAYENEEEELVIHQIVFEKDGCYFVKGLNNLVPDGLCVTREMIKYRLLFSIPTK